MMGPPYEPTQKQSGRLINSPTWPMKTMFTFSFSSSPFGGTTVALDPELELLDGAESTLPDFPGFSMEGGELPCLADFDDFSSPDFFSE